MARFDIISKDGKTIRYSGKPRYSGSYLKPSFLEFSEISSPAPIAWEVGDYVDYPRTGMRYRLYSIPQPSKNARKGSYGGAFTYSNVQFHAATKELEIALFRDLVANDNNIHFSTSPDVATYENVEGIARRIQACMDHFYPGRWEIRMAEFDAVADAEVIEKIATAKDFAMSGGTCLDALSKIYELWEEIGWVHTHENGKEVITIGYANKRIGANTTDAYLYGKGNGLTAIKKNQTNKDEFATRLYVYGSERNLPHRYYNGKDILNAESVDIRNLMLPLDKWGLTDGLPDARKAYLENAEAVAKYGVIPKTHYFDSDDAGADIYPSIEGMTVGQLRKVLADMGETEYSPDASIYPNDSERVDEIFAAPRMVDDGVLKRNGKEHDIENGWYLFAATTPGTTIPKGTAEKTAVVENHLIKDLDIDSQGIIRAKITFTSDKICTLADAGYESVSGVLTLANSLDSPSINEEMGFTFVLNDDGVWEGRLPKVIANYDKQSYVRYVAFATMSVYVTPKKALASDVTASVNISDGYVTFIADQLFDKTFQLTLKQIGFDINERATMGEGKVISMKTGMCAGRNFVISECRYVANADKWVLTCRRQQDDTLGMLFPNKDYQIAEGDKFVLLDIALPEVYIGVAQERLLAEGERLLAKASRLQNHYEPTIDAKVMIESGRTLREGMYMEISDEDVIDNGTDYILIDTLSIYEDESAIPTYKVTLREKRKVTYKGTPSATSETSTKSYGESETANVDIDLSDYATKDYVNNAIGSITPGGDSVKVEGSEFIKVTDGKVELELDSQGGLGNAGQGLGIVEIPQGLLSDYAKKSDLEGIKIDVDTSMSDTSENAVANNVIKKYVDGKAEQAYEQANEYTDEEISHLEGVLQAEIATKQAILVSGTNIKTINNQSIVGDGNIEIQSGGATTRVEMTAASAAIEPNKFYVWPMMDSLDLTLGAEQSGVMNRYLFQFRNPKAGVTMLTLPDTITWSEDTELDENGMPVMETAAFYRIEIIEGLASLKKWKLVYIVFADTEVERVLMANGVGDGIGITKRDAVAVTSIGTWFAKNETIKNFDEFKFFTGVTELGSANAYQPSGFAQCINLRSVSLPPSLKKILGGRTDNGGTASFYGCRALEVVEGIEQLEYIGDRAFDGCVALTYDHLVLAHVTYLGYNALQGMKIKKLSIENVPTLPTAYADTQHYGDKSFLEELTISESVTTIPGYSFYNYTALARVNLNNVITLNANALKGTAVEEVNLLSVVTIGNSGFDGMKKVKKVRIGEHCTSIGVYNFWGWTSDAKVIIIDAITPPTIAGNNQPSWYGATIYVPDASLEEYKTTAGWSGFASIIKGISEYTG